MYSSPFKLTAQARSAGEGLGRQLQRSRGANCGGGDRLKKFPVQNGSSRLYRLLKMASGCGNRQVFRSKKVRAKVRMSPQIETSASERVGWSSPWVEMGVWGEFRRALFKSAGKP